jgi:hypothetical protein
MTKAKDKIAAQSIDEQIDSLMQKKNAEYINNAANKIIALKSHLFLKMYKEGVNEIELTNEMTNATTERKYLLWCQGKYRGIYVFKIWHEFNCGTHSLRFRDYSPFDEKAANNILLTTIIEKLEILTKETELKKYEPLQNQSMWRLIW